MAKKIGDIALGLIILFFCIIGFSLFINEADNSEQVSSGVLASSFSTFKQNVSEVQYLQTELTQQIDNTSDLAPTEFAEQETQGDQGLGVLNLVSKNILTGFLKELSNKLPGANYIVYYLLIPLIGLVVTIVLLRAWRGETKI